MDFEKNTRILLVICNKNHSELEELHYDGQCPTVDKYINWLMITKKYWKTFKSNIPIKLNWNPILDNAKAILDKIL